MSTFPEYLEKSKEVNDLCDGTFGSLPQLTLGLDKKEEALRNQVNNDDVSSQGLNNT